MERQFGPYRLVRQVAVGGMAEIHLAKARGIAGFEKYVALKMIHPNFAEDEQFIEMLVDEAKIAVQLTHHNIAQTFDLGRVGDTYYISMEYVDGADLYKVLRRASEQDIEFPLDVCAFIAKEVASGLDYAHRKRDVAGQPLGIVHRDVSPQNVLVSYAGEVKLVDFGIAKATMKVKQTAAGVIKGKYYYMSPEQASGGRVDARSDIFSAGIVLYEMLTGQMLYLEEDLHRLLDMVRRADIAPPSKLRRGIPPQLERIVMHALAKTPPDRYQSGADMASDLERFLHAYSPVFTPAKVVNLLRQAVGDATLNVENEADSIQPLDGSELMRQPGEMRDSNSVIFRVKPRPLSEGFPHIDTNGATDQHGLEIGEVVEMAGGGTRSADAMRVEPPKLDSKKPESRKPAPRPPTAMMPEDKSGPVKAPVPMRGASGGSGPVAAPVAPRRPETRRPEDKPAPPRPAMASPSGPAASPAGSGPIPRIRQQTAPLPNHDAIPRRSPSSPTRPLPSGAAGASAAAAGPPARPATAPAFKRDRGFDEDTRELPNDFSDENAPQTGVIEGGNRGGNQGGNDGGSGAPGKAASPVGAAAAAGAGKVHGSAAPQAEAKGSASGGVKRPGTGRPESGRPGPSADATANGKAAKPASAPAVSVMPMYGLDDMEGGDSTMVSQMPNFNSETGVSPIPNFNSETGEVENTFVNVSVPVPEHTDYGETQIRSSPPSPLERASTTSSSAGSDDEDGPTTPGSTARAPTNSGGGGRQRPAIGKPAALAAKNPTPAVSELRKPRPSRSTPTGGVPNVLQAIVAAPGSEPMPAAPRRASTPPPIPQAQAPTAAPAASAAGFEPTLAAPHPYQPAAGPHQAPPEHGAAPPPTYGMSGQETQVLGPESGQYSGVHGMHPGHPGGPAPYGAPGHPQSGQGSGPMAAAGSSMLQQLPQQFAHLSGQFPQQSGALPAANALPSATGPVMIYGQPGQPYPQQMGYPMMQPGAFPQGVPAPTATGRLRALELDEIPPHYRIKREGPRWFVLLGIALTAVATAASVTFLVLRANRQQAISSAALRLESFPAGAVVFVDDKRLAEPTPVVYRNVKPSGRYTVRLELPKHKPYTQEITIATTGGEVAITPTLQPLTGKVRVLSDPPGADVFINSLPRGKTPVTVSDLDMDNTKYIELRHPRCDPFRQELAWPENGTVDLDIKLVPVATR